MAELFHMFDRNNQGRIGVIDAYHFFLFGVSTEILRIAWANVDREGRGYITKEQFGVFSRLVSVAQLGGSIDLNTSEAPWFQT